MPKKHESYGMLSFTHSTIGGDGLNLFGSSIKHNNVIKMRVSSAELTRNNNNDRYFSSCSFDETFVEVEMSYSQFAEAITSHGMGMGVPVTVIRQGGHRMEPCPFEDKQTQFKQESKDFSKEIIEKLKDRSKQIETLLTEKKTLNKSDRDMIVSVLKSTLQDVEKNMPFVHDMYMEQMDKTTLEAKGEVEAFVQNKMNQIALLSIAESQENLLKLDSKHEPMDETLTEKIVEVDSELEPDEEPYHGPTMGM